MRLLNLRINFDLLRTFCPHLGSFFFLCFFFHYVSAKFHLWPSSGDFYAIRRTEVKFGRNVVKEETTHKKQKKYQDEDKKSAINKN